MKNTEQIIRKVTAIGNGAHIFAPREWLDEEVILVRKPKKPVNERILEVLQPYFEHIQGIYLYGSQARGEARHGSDIDLLVITDTKMSIKKQGYEVICLQQTDLPAAIKLSPVLIYAALAEAKPIMNASLLDELQKKYKPQWSDFKEYLVETKSIIKINEELFDPYSIMLRLRGIYIITYLLKGQHYSNKLFLSWIKKANQSIDVGGLYDAYKKGKAGYTKKVGEEEVRPLLDVLKEKLDQLEKKIHGKTGKKA